VNNETLFSSLRSYYQIYYFFVRDGDTINEILTYINPVIVRKAEFTATSTSFVFLLLDHAREPCSALGYTRARLLVLSVLAAVPHLVPASLFNSAQRDKTFCRTDVRCGLKVKDQSSFTPRHLGFISNVMVFPSTKMFSRRPTSRALSLYKAYTVFSLLS